MAQVLHETAERNFLDATLALDVPCNLLQEIIPRLQGGRVEGSIYILKKFAGSETLHVGRRWRAARAQ